MHLLDSLPSQAPVFPCWLQGHVNSTPSTVPGTMSAQEAFLNQPNKKRSYKESQLSNSPCALTLGWELSGQNPQRKCWETVTSTPSPFWWARGHYGYRNCLENLGKLFFECSASDSERSYPLYQPQEVVSGFSFRTDTGLSHLYFRASPTYTLNI